MSKPTLKMNSKAPEATARISLRGGQQQEISPLLLASKVVERKVANFTLPKLSECAYLRELKAWFFPRSVFVKEMFKTP